MQHRMAIVSRHVNAPSSAVWSVLADGWSYPSWVVGTTRIRAVDENWPAPGAVLHHAFGVWPLMLKDRTEVLDSEPGRRLSLRVRGWPAGEARADISLEPEDNGTRVVLDERLAEGPGSWLYGPAQDRLMAFRLQEMADRLAAIAEGRSHPADQSDPAAGHAPGL